MICRRVIDRALQAERRRPALRVPVRIFDYGPKVARPRGRLAVLRVDGQPEFLECIQGLGRLVAGLERQRSGALDHQQAIVQRERAIELFVSLHVDRAKGPVQDKAVRDVPSGAFFFLHHAQREVVGVNHE